MAIKLNKTAITKSLVVTVLIVGALLSILENINTLSQVEPYCSTTYSHDVEAYKACKAKSPSTLLKTLTEREKERNTIPNLSMLTPVE